MCSAILGKVTADAAAKRREQALAEGDTQTANALTGGKAKVGLNYLLIRKRDQKRAASGIQITR
ncbi:hypothetical protein [Phenylobacterium sp.]|uniref:hypothetical protein n=1 Tax=Phenylobacterium sp. TaxID=1871053 RepID=UPI00393A2276